MLERIRCLAAVSQRGLLCGKRRLQISHRSFAAESSPFEYDPQLKKQDMDYCLNVVRQRDRESFYCGLLMPKEAQHAFFALRALNAELASVKDGHNLRSASDTSQSRDYSSIMALQMRMTWWRNAINEIYEPSAATERSSVGDPLNLSVSCWHNPVVRALRAAHQRHELTKRFLQRLIDAREADLEVNQYASVHELEVYSEQTVSSLLYLQLETVNVREEAADEVASRAGVGIGLVTALRSTPYRLLHGEVPIPADLLGKGFPYNELVSWASDEYTISNEDAQILDEAIRTVVSTASSHIRAAQEQQGHVPTTGKPCLLPLIPSIHFLTKLEQSKFNLFDEKLQEETRLKLLLRLGRSWLTGVV